ncbi:protein SRG1-like [Trifolium pratense]|nr:protein SRG1-like [Trifolium pratense]
MDITSIVVPSVQELAKEQLTVVPDQYVIQDQETVVLSSLQVPVLDLGKLLSEDLNLKGQELKRLDYACKEWGFFQLVNHGISTSLVENMKRDTKALYELSKEEKKKLWQKEGEMEGFGQANVISKEQKLEWGDTFFLKTQPPHSRNPNKFNQMPQTFRENLEIFSAELEKLTIKIIELMANALAINPKEMTELFNIGTQFIRVNYYPPCPQPEKVVGIKSHSDACALTILLQISDIEGLQVLKDEQWIPVKPLPDAFIVNIGDMLEVITNGIYPSILHRATVNTEIERISLAAFHGPNTQAMLAPAPSLVTQERPAQFRKISVLDHFNGFFSQELHRKSYLNQMRITESGE